MLHCCWIRCCNSARPIALYWRLQHLITQMQAQECFNQPLQAMPPIRLPSCPYWRGTSTAPVFRGTRQIPPQGPAAVQGRQRQRRQGLDGVGVRGYGHGTTGRLGTEAGWVTNLQDKLLAAGRPPALDFLRILS
jgi:hypothetical protein